MSDLTKRFDAQLQRFNARLIAGPNSRCLASISSCTNLTGYKTVISLNRMLDPTSPEALEALVVQLGFLATHPESFYRFRLVSGRETDKGLVRAWRMGARMAIADRDLVGMWERGWDDDRLAEATNTTARLVEWRRHDWAIARGTAFATPRPRMSMEYSDPGDAVTWCEN